ncbi:MAG: hypothetical protein H0X25_08990 [Acidobacteriales bacterium]|nr:hypothetical protein [Terriglobales bacterium]
MGYVGTTVEEVGDKLRGFHFIGSAWLRFAFPRVHVDMECTYWVIVDMLNNVSKRLWSDHCSESLVFYVLIVREAYVVMAEN